VTATQIVVGETRFRRVDGHQPGRTWVRSYIAEPTEDVLRSVRRDAALSRLKNAHWDRLPDAVLEQCALIVSQVEQGS